MRCGSEIKSVETGCKCGGNTVFEGASIGQVFTGHVELKCPLVGPGAPEPAGVEKSRDRGSPWVTALLTIALWQAWMALPTGTMGSSGYALHSGLFLFAGVASQYLSGRITMAFVGAIWRRLSQTVFRH